MGLTRFFNHPLFLRGLGVVATLGLLAIVIVFGTARLAMAQGDYGKAQLLPGGVADGASAYAVILLKEGDKDGADLAARRALGATLANPRALRVLGQIRDAAKQDTAPAFFGAAGLWGWRDTPAQLWLFRYKLETGDVPGAMQHMDSLLRRNQEFDTMFRAVSLLGADPAGLKAMLPYLEAQPLWRGHFLNATYHKDVDAKGVQAIMLALAGTSAPPSDAEVRAVVKNLVSRGNKAEAAAIWARFHPGESLDGV